MFKIHIFFSKSPLTFNTGGLKFRVAKLRFFEAEYDKIELQKVMTYVTKITSQFFSNLAPPIKISGYASELC